MLSLKNKTALVTGASSGIGESIARKLAEAGAQLVLVARSEPVLLRLAEELTKTYGSRCTVITADLSRPDCAVQLQREIQSKDLQIDILINNAGVGTYGPFETLSAKAELSEIALNVSAVVELTHAFIPSMLSRQSGVVLNIASTAAFQPTPYMAVYGATKAFVLSFSEALWAEFHDRGVRVIALCPGPVETSFIGKLGDPSIRQTSVFSRLAKPEHVADMALKALHSSSPTHILGFKNWLFANLIRFVPRRVVAKAGAGMLMPSHLKHRN
jgi:short-subunit dehydrogenase